VLSVNVSAQQLASPRLLESVRGCIAELAPWPLALELTESTLMDDTPAVRAVVDALARAGARLSIDDFGTGYSSLAYLTRLPVTSLKIDRGFVAELVDRPRAATVAAAVNGLGTELGLVVVAEGVETVEQRDALQAMGCRFAQGYLFGAPVPAEQVDRLLRARARSEGVPERMPAGG
jgi:EAL domain-containing protein (putative c-di-GMP-specific phosphodiesterase class I)